MHQVGLQQNKSSKSF